MYSGVGPVVLQNIQIFDREPLAVLYLSSVRISAISWFVWKIVSIPIMYCKVQTEHFHFIAMFMFCLKIVSIPIMNCKV